MKKLLVIGLIAVAFGCSKPSGYQIEVALTGASGKVFLEQREGGRFAPKDTAEIVEGVAVLEGKVEFPDMYYISVEGMNQRGVIFVENVKMKVTGHVDSLRTIRITGSTVNDEYLAIKNELDRDNEAGMAKYLEYQQAVQAGDTVNAAAIMKEVQTIFEGQDAKKLDFVKSHPTSWVTPMYLAQLQYNMKVQELDSILTALDPKLAVVPSVVSMKEQVEKLKKVAVGETAPDFSMNNPEGNPVKLSDVYAKNKYTLIDFWAAWCGPCRQENPNIVATYAKFNPKGFGILGVSLDQDRDRWLKAIEDDKLTWMQVSDLQYWQNQAAGMYGVNSIPANFLVDQTGKIVGHNLRGEELGSKLAELLP